MAGLNVPSSGGVARLTVQAAPSLGPVRLDLRSAGRRVASIALDGGERAIAWSSAFEGLTFVEVRAVDIETGAPAPLHVIVTPR